MQHGNCGNAAYACRKLLCQLKVAAAHRHSRHATHYLPLPLSLPLSSPPPSQHLHLLETLSFSNVCQRVAKYFCHFSPAFFPAGANNAKIVSSRRVSCICRICIWYLVARICFLRLLKFVVVIAKRETKWETLFSV